MKSYNLQQFAMGLVLHDVRLFTVRNRTIYGGVIPFDNVNFSEFLGFFFLVMTVLLVRTCVREKVSEDHFFTFLGKFLGEIG